jgi:hypothetical protein
MSNVFDDIEIAAKNNTKPADENLLKPGKESVAASPATKKRGRPPKQHVENSAQEAEKSNKVTYLTRSTKAKLQQVQAILLIHNQEALTESQLVDRALDYYILNNNLKMY